MTATRFFIALGACIAVMIGGRYLYELLDRADKMLRRATEWHRRRSIRRAQQEWRDLADYTRRQRRPPQSHRRW